MSTRDYRIDRAKGILIFLVVLGHLLARTSPWESPILGAPMYFIYMFHMPAFVFLAGITAKSNKLAERVLTYFVLLATVLPLMWGWMWIFGLNPDYDFLRPFWYTWFLLSMAWWMITVPFIERFPRTMLVASLVVGLFGGLLPILDTELSAARTMAFWPFFVIGKLYGKQIIGWAGSLALWQKLGLSVAALAAVGYFYLDQVDHYWLYGSLNFAHFGVSVPEGVGLRLIVDLGAVLLTLALLTWLSNTKDTIATIGKHSLAVYILHGFVVRGLQPVLDDSRTVLHDAVVLLICVALAVVWTGVLSWGPFERALRWWSSTVTGLLLKPFPFLRPEDSDRRGGRGGRGRRGDAYYSGDAHHPGNAYSEGDGPDRQGLGLQPLPGVGYQHSPGFEQQPGQQQSFASPAPVAGEAYPLPGSHEVPQNNATYETTQEVPAGAAQRAMRYRRLPVYLSGDEDS
ncbi:acyltransferase family protein [Brevibacterium linens]|uniref:Fucose 4-O-acetylase n=1 Tax=Brevibacterium linens ATCC 9172 TaxID=1255617 RepID=A0A2H1IG23_BRELN|nr:acyltransferase family protein [Brevibacterium linens]KAB1948512.1 acyltransferase family protein [Brevibacterium linens ATCC 9172]SMX74159.1 Fucose 4-O-acetylase [Brevibacterium linens ATCC 9172]